MGLGAPYTRPLSIRVPLWRLLGRVGVDLDAEGVFVGGSEEREEDEELEKRGMPEDFLLFDL